MKHRLTALIEAIAREEKRLAQLDAERTAILARLDELRDSVKNLVVLQGSMGVKQRRKVMEHLVSIPDDEERLILATGGYIGEGFDDARLDTLFLSLPFSWKGMMVQYAGRFHRLHPGKEEVRVYDYVDGSVPMLANMHEKRMKGFRAMGYERQHKKSSDTQQNL